MKLRILNAPQPIAVREDESGRPIALRRAEWASPRRVLNFEDCWRIDDEWWTASPVSRIYYELEVEGGVRVGLFHDLVAKRWFEQHAGAAVAAAVQRGR
ncbi:MAG: hypothetical protein JO247_24360 [Chloroflexi bacterium]|nr:hypothetical protein [Chloroflexota bacterium]